MLKRNENFNTLIFVPTLMIWLNYLVKYLQNNKGNIREAVFPGSFDPIVFNIPHGTDVAELTRKHIMESKWYQIYTKPNAEKKLYNRMKSCGLQVFLPIKIVKKQWCDRVKLIEEPALKSYIFAKLSIEEMRIVERLTGFCFFVTYGCPNKTVRNPKISYPDITDSTIKLIALVLIEYPNAIWQESTVLKGNKIEFIYGSLKNYQGFLIKNSLGTKVAIKIPGLKHAFIINVLKTMLKKVNA